MVPRKMAVGVVGEPVAVAAVAVAAVAVGACWCQNQVLQDALGQDDQSCFRRRVRCWGQHDGGRSTRQSIQNVGARSLLVPACSIQRQVASD